MSPSCKSESALAKVTQLKQQHNIKPLVFDDTVNAEETMVNCRTCKDLTPTSKMEKRKRVDGSIAYDRCNNCVKKKADLYKATENGYIVKLLNGTRNSSARRAATRKIAAAHTLTVEQVKQKLVTQNRQCAISGIPFKLARQCDWQMSIERINETKDYSDANCVSICLEFQTASQWTREKFLHAFTHTDTVDHDVLGEASIPTFVSAEPITRLRRKMMIDEIQHYKCYGCAQWLVETGFKERRAGEALCLICSEAFQYGTGRPWTKKFGSLVNSSESNTKLRNGKGRDMQGSITLEEIREVFVDQQGLCAYSGLRLQLTGNFKASLERVNPDFGYYPWNVCLIAAEFNSIDRRAYNTDLSNTAGSNWTKEKYDAVRTAYHSNTMQTL